MTAVPDILDSAVEHALTVLLIGDHGVGKTQMVRDAARRGNLLLKYYSSPTLDPYADLVGIPVPVADHGGNGAEPRHLEFVRPRDVEDAQLVFFDELNRAHPKIQNAVLEMIQFRSINGAALPNLKMVWAAINPPGDIYSVSELDPALVDRFALHVLVPAAPSVQYYRENAGIPERIAAALVLWWNRDLSPELRRQISPRRLEYLGQVIARGLRVEWAIPPSLHVPLQNLLSRIE